ncbi:MAG: hypothetical protein IJ702_09110 [Fretibacterium sp.]|nr:hypothetical protein [Fretibacterium sp.]
MAKIRFNLDFSGRQIRTVEDLRENFSREEVLKHYKNGTLARWLDVCGYPAELEQLRLIRSTEDYQILAALNRIFAVKPVPAASPAPGGAKADASAVVLQPQVRGAAFESALQGYNSIVRDIDAHPEDLHYIYAHLDELAANYPALLGLNSSNLFYHFLDKAPLASFALFGNSATRPWYALSEDRIKRDQNRLKYIHNGIAATLYCGQFSTRFTPSPAGNVARSSDLAGKLAMINLLLDMVEGEQYKHHLKRFEKYFFSLPAGWNHVVPRGQKYMLLLAGFTSYDQNTRFASPNNREDYTLSTELSARLPIFDGIDIYVKDSVGLQYFYYIEAR